MNLTLKIIDDELIAALSPHQVFLVPDTGLAGHTYDELKRLARAHAVLTLAKYSPDQPRDDHGKFGSGGSGLTLTPSSERAWNGTPVELDNKPSKQESGALGEQVALAYLRSQGANDAEPLNLQTNNFPVDMIHDHELVEVKTGLVSNGESAMHWRATIGEPGPKEKAWLAKAKPEAKAKWNAEKQQAILDRKNQVVKDFSKKEGTRYGGKTLTVLLNPDTRTADVHMFDGFHSLIRWKSDQAKAGYVGSFKY